MWRNIGRVGWYGAATWVTLTSGVKATNQGEGNRKVYIWGNGIYQARPGVLLQFRNFRPHQITNLPQMKQLQFREKVEGGITLSGELYVWHSHHLDSNPPEQDEPLDRDNRRNGLTKLCDNAKRLCFTNGFVWALKENGEVLQWPITYDPEIQFGKPRSVLPLKGSVDIKAGQDHLIALTEQGEVYAMGDDTYGQCGQGSQGRMAQPPFNSSRVKFPSKVEGLPKISRIFAGYTHSLALDEAGNLYGWGSNSKMQLSHEDEYSRVSDPWLCFYKPVKIVKNLDDSRIESAQLGQEFTMVNTTNRLTNSFEAYSMGCNLKGQLGINEVKHVKDISRVEGLSNYVYNGQKVRIDQLKCGRSHCIALLNIGYILTWGDNEAGQQGNQKRTKILTPTVFNFFKGRKVVSVHAGWDTTGVILEEDSPISKDKQVGQINQ